MISSHTQLHDNFRRMSGIYPSELNLSLNNEKYSRNMKSYHLKAAPKPINVSFNFSEPIYNKTSVATIRKSLRSLSKSESIDYEFSRIFSNKYYQERFAAKKLNKQLYRAMSDIKRPISFEIYTPVTADMKLFEKFIRRIKNQIQLGVIKLKVDRPEDLHRMQDFLSRCFNEEDRAKKIHLEICIDLSFRFSYLIDTWLNYMEKVGTDFCKGIHKAYFIRNDFLETECLSRMLQIIKQFDNNNEQFSFSLLTSDKEEVEAAITELRTLQDFMKKRRNSRISIDLRENGGSLESDQLLELPCSCQDLTLEWQSKVDPETVKIEGDLKSLRVLRIDFKGLENWIHCNNIIASAPALEEIEMISTDDDPRIFEPLGAVFTKLCNLKALRSLELQLLVKAPYTPEIFSNLCKLERLRVLNLRIDYSERKSLRMEEEETPEECKSQEINNSMEIHLQFLQETLMRIESLSKLESFSFTSAKADQSCIQPLLQLIKRNRKLTYTKLVLMNPLIQLDDLEEIMSHCRKFSPIDATLEIHLAKQKDILLKGDEMRGKDIEVRLKKSYSLGECEIKVFYREFEEALGML